MSNCPDCGKETNDQHTCIEYERNRADELQKQLELLSIEFQLLRDRVRELEHMQAGRTPWRNA